MKAVNRTTLLSKLSWGATHRGHSDHDDGDHGEWEWQLPQLSKRSGRMSFDGWWLRSWSNSLVSCQDWH